MQPLDAKLDDLRRQIDEIDSKLHELLMRRSAVVAEIGQRKGGNAGAGNCFFRPGREATILRRLVARHQGSLAKATIVRMWRELLSATLRLQGPFTVAVYATDERSGFWDLSRDHFGSQTPATAFDRVGQVLRAVTDGQATVGVLPLPQQDDSEAWWPLLLSKEANQPRVIARLPFGGAGNARGPVVEALVVGRLAQEETGKDRGLFAVESAGEISRSGLRAALEAVDLPPVFIHPWRDPNDAATWHHLVEVDGCVWAEDGRLRRLAETGPAEIRQIWPLGGYAVPLSAAELE
ncbi:MAG: chorismate mutase [Dongiaceae bacterium]